MRIAAAAVLTGTDLTYPETGRAIGKQMNMAVQPIWDQVLKSVEQVWKHLPILPSEASSNTMKEQMTRALVHVQSDSFGDAGTVGNEG